MDKKMERYKKPTGLSKKIQDTYINSKDAIKKYVLADLSKIENIDLYFLMGLESYRDTVIPEGIIKHVGKIKKRQYHPDISKGPKELFFHVERGIQILGNQRMREIYDGSFYKVDVPKDRIYKEEEFFEVFGNCFDVYGRFSVNKPVPRLMKDGPVDEFYRFWNNYKTEKTYIPIDEYMQLRPDDRQFFVRDNEERLTKLKNEDILKVKKIISLCHKRDPRIKSVEDQLAELKLKEQNPWFPTEIQTLRKFCMLFSKNVKNKWEIITEKLNQATKNKRTVKDVMEKAAELKIKK